MARADAGATQQVIDLHVHYYTDTFVDAIKNAPAIKTSWRDDGRLVARWRSGVALTVVQPHPGVAQRIEVMDEAGIAMSVLSVPSPNAYFLDGEDARKLAANVNSEFAEIVRDHPDRFAALGMVVMQDTDLALASLDHAMDELQMSGVMLLTNVNGVPLDDERFEPFWQAANDRHLLVYVHPTVPEVGDTMQDHALAISVGFFQDTNLAISRLAYSGVFERYPDIRWVFSHLGGTLPFMLPRLDSYWRQFPDARAKSPRPPSEYIRELVFDTATTHKPALTCACDTFGFDRLVFGSDYPHVPGGPGPFLDVLDVLGASGEDRAALLGGRARRLLDGERI